MPAVRKHWARVVQAVLVIAAAVAAFAAVVPTSASASLSTSPIALTDKGFIRGTSSGNVHAFRGIPYAAPPVGDLRWRAPQPAAAWPGVRDATQFGAHCAQVAGPFGRVSQSEDCLFLNVFAPRRAIPGVPFAPVMVWIHGGALVVGESDDYDPPRWWTGASSSSRSTTGWARSASWPTRPWPPSRPRVRRATTA